MKVRYLGLAALVALPWMGARSGATGAAPKSTATPQAVGAPAIALLVGEPLGRSTALHFVSPSMAGAGDASLGPAVGHFEHAPGAAIRAVTGKGGAESATVFVVADLEADKDLSFAGGLLRLRAGEDAKKLADRVIHSSRPVVAPDGKVVVARGEPGVASRDTMRVDVLWVDEIDPETGDTRTLCSIEGYLLYVIGATAREVVVYRVSPAGADIVAIDRQSKAERTIEPKLPPFARDFSLDPEDKTLTFLDRPDESFVPPGTLAEWRVVRVDLTTLGEKELHRGTSMGVVPFALPNGDVLVSLDPAKGPSTLFGPPPSLGQGVAEPAGLSRDRAFLTGVTRAPGELGRPFVLDLSRNVARFVDVPLDERVIVAGFVSAAPTTAKGAL